MLNPVIMRWARESAGMSLEQAVGVLHLGPRKQKAVELLSSYEDGEVEPDRNVLSKMAKAYRRPMLTFYLSQPPSRADRGEDFRTLPDARRVDDAIPLDVLLRDVHVRQRLIKTAIENTEEAHLLPFIGSETVQQGTAKVVEKMRAIMKFDLAEFRRKRTVNDAFTYARSLLESNGVFVMLIGNLGSHHSNLSAQVFRGFALSDTVAPLIVINDQDAPSAWSFTLLHEFAHLLLGVTGISGGGYEKAIEKFCNEVASEVLLPAEDLSAWSRTLDGNDDLTKRIDEYARTRKVSRSLIAYRLHTSGRIDEEQWMKLSEFFHNSWVQQKEAIKAKARNKDGGPDYYVVKRHKVGTAVVELVRRTLAEGTITPTKAGKVLGVKPTNVELMLATN
jgi:Zn-dependent peptidase ImmA (M78 family)